MLDPVKDKVFSGSVEDVKEEVSLLNLENIRKFPCGRSIVEDFYSMWSRFGPEAARTIMIPAIWYGYTPLPSEVFGG